MTKYAIAFALCMFGLGAVIGHSTASTQVLQDAEAARTRGSVPTFELMLMARNLPVETFDAI